MNIKKQYEITIKIPENITLEKKENSLLFSGPLGNSSINFKKIDPMGLCGISLNLNNQELKFITHSKSFYGLFKTLIENKLQGVSRGFLIYLKIIGIGYRAHLENNTLYLKLGYSHDIIYKMPSSIKIFLLEPTLICLFGIDKNQITQVAAKIRDLRRPSVYKGKGIRLAQENIILKAGKRK